MAKRIKGQRKNQRAAERRRKELKRQAAAHEKRMAEEKANPRPNPETNQRTARRFKTKNFVGIRGNCDLEASLMQKLSGTYDVWVAVYTTSRGVTVPYMFIADNGVSRRETYMGDHREEIYRLFDESFEASHSKLSSVEQPCVVAMTNPPDGQRYGVMWINNDVFIRIGEAAGVGQEAAMNSEIAQLNPLLAIVMGA